MSITIRRATEADADALSHICLHTADAGKPADQLHDYGELPGLVYAVPYVKLPTTWGFVMVDGALPTTVGQGPGQVVGYIIGSTDTRAYEAYAAEHWWPGLAEKYTVGRLAPGKAADEQYMKLLGNMHVAPEANVGFSGAHLHIDILEGYQRQGWGRRLIGKAVEYLRGEGLEGVWLGLSTENVGARLFYGKLGFVDVEGAPDGNMGLKFVDWKE